MLRRSVHLRPEHRDLIILVCLAIGLSAWHARADGRSWPETAARRALGPLQVAFATAAIATRDAVRSVTQAGELARENRALREEMGKLQTANARLHEYFRRYKAMSEQLRLNNDGDLYECPAVVVSHSGGNWSRRVEIVVGEGWRIVAGDAVLAGGALAGFVAATDTDGRRGTVRLLLDKDSAVSGMDQRSRYAGMIYGPDPSAADQNLLRMSYVSKQADVRVHDKIVTSGAGMIYPKGLLIGEVLSVGRCLASDVSKTAAIRPAADMGRLEYVWVLRR
ncbi:MAG: rod shape-determining protein MreC [Armatimonadota bacterium]|jgi:rod shape-determining protein MreC